MNTASSSKGLQDTLGTVVANLRRLRQPFQALAAGSVLVATLTTLGEPEGDAVIATRKGDAGNLAPFIEPIDVHGRDFMTTRIDVGTCRNLFAARAKPCR